MTIQKFLDTCRQFFTDVEVAYVHPSLYIFCINQQFHGLTEEAREERFFQTTGISSGDYDRIVSNANVSPQFLSQEERRAGFGFVDAVERPQHWLPLLDKGSTKLHGPAESGPVPAIHFYGFKGGQARSTVLAMLAKNLANDGYRVLTVDADIEAPSLDELFDAGVPTIDSTLMGACGWSETLEPIPAYASTAGGGIVDIVPCRPRDETYDMDFATFGLRVSLDIKILRSGVEKIKELVASDTDEPRYDVVLFDHRTGIAPSVLPIVQSWRGATVVSVRPDGLSNQAVGAFQTLFAQNPDTPGAYVYYSLSEDDRRADLADTSNSPVMSLLDALSRALAMGAEEDEQLGPEYLQKYWIGWSFDTAFLRKTSPAYEELDKKNQRAIQTLRQVLSLAGPAPAIKSIVKLPPSSPSGNLDFGWFIETNDITRLFSPSSRVSYIAGRKGTGKTRLYREMINRNLGQPLFCSADYVGGGLHSSTSDFDKLFNACNSEPKRFWWALLSIALSCKNTNDDDEFRAQLNAFCDLSESERIECSQSYNVAEIASKASERVYFIDGIETAVTVAKLRPFIEELLQFMLMLQSDTKLKGCQCRLFIRTDLLDAASQNIEQQVNQRIVYLRWDSKSIFNYVLARIERIEWFREKFPLACKSILDNIKIIRSGELPSEAYEKILLEIFPAKLKRNNLQTLTFLETYFSDASGKVDGGTSFYPRLFEKFLTDVAARGARDPAGAMENGRISHVVVLDAHVEATMQFVNEVKTELYVLLELDTNGTKNTVLVDQLVDAFVGLQTPFQLDKMLAVLSEKVSIEKPKLRVAVTQMAEVGIFERHPKNPGEFRAGRLYKSALGMKYVR